jgi:hypothetical protein
MIFQKYISDQKIAKVASNRHGKWRQGPTAIGNGGRERYTAPTTVSTGSFYSTLATFLAPNKSPNKSRVFSKLSC